MNIQFWFRFRFFEIWKYISISESSNNRKSHHLYYDIFPKISEIFSILFYYII